MTTTDTDPFAAAPQRVETNDDDDLIRNGRYYLPHPDYPDGKFTYFTRATTWAKSIADTFRLNLWGLRNAIKGLTMDEGLYAEVATTPLEDRDGLDKLAERCKEKAGSKTRASLGTAEHKFSEQLDSGEITLEQVPSLWRPDLAAYLQAMKDLGLEVPEHLGRPMIEVTCWEPVYNIIGTLDRIVRLTRDLDVLINGKIYHLKAGELLIFDLKTGRDLEYGWLEIVIQLALYAHAKKIVDRKTKKWIGDMPEGIRQDVALVLHLPVGEHKATVYGIDIVTGWTGSALIQAVRAFRNNRKLAAPVLVVDPDADTSRSASWLERVASAATLGTLESIRLEALGARAWTPDVERAALDRAVAIRADTVA